MTNKVKLFFVLIAFLAVISVVTFFDVFTGVRALFTPEQEPLAQVSPDTDKDGLSDVEESYWGTDFQNTDTDKDGFVDGEEVASGHDPLTPGPYDILQNTNITDQMANLTIGGLYEGDLRLDSPAFDQSLDDLTLSIVSDGLASFVSKVDPSKVILTEETEGNKTLYYDNVSNIWSKLTQALYEEGVGIGTKLELMNNGGLANQEFIKYFTSQRDIFQLIATEAVQIPVPPSLTQKHIDLVGYISQLAEINGSLADGENDPIRAALGFNVFVDLIENFPVIAESFSAD